MTRNVPLGRMACSGCDGTYAVGFLRCPHCHARSPLYPERIATAGRTPTVVEGTVQVVEDDGAVSVGFGWEPEDEPAPAVEGAAQDAVPVRRPRGRPRKIVGQVPDDVA